MHYRTHPAADNQEANGLWIMMPDGQRFCVQVDPRGRLLIEVEGQAGIAVIPVTSGAVAIVAT